MVSTIDNFIRPYLISQGARLPLLLIFVGVIGGLLAYGFIGLFVGATLLGVGYTLFRSWLDEEPPPPTASLLTALAWSHRDGRARSSLTRSGGKAMAELVACLAPGCSWPATAWARSRSACCLPAGPAPATSAAIGSGNIGATNVLRTGRKGLALATLLLDLAKGAAAQWPSATPGSAPRPRCWRVRAPSSATASRSGSAFSGGKGVATAAGVVLGLTPILFPVILVAFIAVVAATRWVSLGSIVAACLAPVAALAAGQRAGHLALSAGGGPGRLQAPREHRPAAEGPGEPAELRRQAGLMSR